MTSGSGPPLWVQSALQRRRSVARRNVRCRSSLSPWTGFAVMCVYAAAACCCVAVGVDRPAPNEQPQATGNGAPAY
jgi:hypothetical protein